MAQLDNPQSLRLLIEQNRQVLAPMLFGSGKGQKNFRGVDASQEYCRNAVKIVKDNDRCVSFILRLHANSIEMNEQFLDLKGPVERRCSGQVLPYTR